MGILDVLNQYANLASGTASANANQHFGDVAPNVSREDLGQGIAAAFRADQTPPFESMVGQLFGRSDPQQRAGLLNQLLRGLSPSVLGSLRSTSLGPVLHNGQVPAQVSADEAAQVRANDVQDLSRHAAQANPGIVDRIAQFYAQHPALVQTLGNAALTIALTRLAQRRAA